MLRRLLVLVAVLISLPAISRGQTDSPFPRSSAARTAANSETMSLKRSGLLHLLDPSKFSMSQSYTMMMSSGGGVNGANGLYVNTLRYQVSPNALLTVNLGYLQQFSSWGGGGTGGNNAQHRILPSVGFTYRPSQNTVFQISYETSDPRLGYGRFQSTDTLWGARSRLSTDSLLNP